ncbi:lysophospholipase [Rhizobium sp. RU20A]|uniref:alpha/beta fold hydrolase n=1 Tax=Rhizobium sp. RU20A TaxID=1907412 RepID=UPI000955DBAB|nr:alpha/beta hydrolase [Rhizobium sp. RU20A]SIQ39878.1 lysophospholipase [Rhizobium sp. RU20A]
MSDILFETADNPAPGDGTAGFLDGAGGAKIRYAIFRSEGSARGTVILLQGRNESIEKYFETIRELNAAGLWVATFDWRGQGGSSRLLRNAPRRGHVRRFADYESDLQLFLERIVLPDTRMPFFLLAHSTGGLVALSMAPKLSGRIDRMVLSAPFLALGAQAVGEGAIARLASIACMLGLGSRALNRDRGNRPFETNLLTSDPIRFQRNAALLAAHPDLGLGPPSARWLHEAFITIRRVARHEHLTRITIPTLVLAPTADRLVPHLAVENLCSIFRASHMVPIDGARHELFQEADRYRSQAMAAILAFIPGSVEEGPASMVGKTTIAAG